MDVITVSRTSDGVAWAAAPCGCMIELLADRRELERFVEHVTDRTPCDPDQNRDATIEKSR